MSPTHDLPAIGAPATRALEAIGVRNLAQLATRTEAEVEALHGMGPKAIGLLKQALHAKGLAFRKRASLTANAPEPTVFSTPDKLRAWLAKHHDGERELWMKYYKAGSGKKSVVYQEALDEALCFGWIDGVVKRIDDESYMQRWTPRKKGSYWSAVNVKKAEALIAAGRMAPPGLAVFEARDKGAASLYSFENGPQELPPEAMARLRAAKGALSFWNAQPPSYRKAATWWIVSAKKEETRARRIAKLVEHSARAERLPQFVSPARKKDAPVAARPRKERGKPGKSSNG